MVFQTRTNFVPQTMAEQYQMETLYRQQLHAEDDDGSAQSFLQDLQQSRGLS